MVLDKRLKDLLNADTVRMEALALVHDSGLPDCWIGAGFVRDAVWDHLHSHRRSAPHGDVDVVWYDARTYDEDLDRQIESQLRSSMPTLQWSVKNQARMHVRNGDRPYRSVSDAMRHWPETATAVAAAIDASGAIRINAPFGLDDLFAPRLLPTPAFLGRKLPIYEERVSSKRWVERYPLLDRTIDCPAADART